MSIFPRKPFVYYTEHRIPVIQLYRTLLLHAQNLDHVLPLGFDPEPYIQYGNAVPKWSWRCRKQIRQIFKKRKGDWSAQKVRGFLAEAHEWESTLRKATEGDSTALEQVRCKISEERLPPPTPLLLPPPPPIKKPKVEWWKNPRWAGKSTLALASPHFLFIRPPFRPQPIRLTMMIRNKRRTLQKRWDLLHKLQDHDLVHAIVEDRWERLLEANGVAYDGVTWEKEVVIAINELKEKIRISAGGIPVEAMNEEPELDE
ncbi:hypothetical protein G7K_0907-t1 [Saitoella complicata NRRL Y-17804]|uniref:Uncharacterized protein n=1 Tax=Saitoella complicata (strain BCRC 22490 / CBS 7301 / JCM 7358 / NBRC 10748 / NRRL Y-17804) TaxID=698492 RepID=A0A0E9NA61_SAICN|nr:hypothetical protein G7K_0907-t1 [Saitoella complicata NRRL Y-17804]